MFILPLLVFSTVLMVDDPALPAGVTEKLATLRERADGDVLVVDCHGRLGYSSIQSAIDDAVTGDVVVVLPRNHLGVTCSGDLYTERINYRGKGVEVRSLDPEDPQVVRTTVIHGNHEGSVVVMQEGEPREAVLNGLTITGGKTDMNGGGVCVKYGCPTIRNCIITGNDSRLGGGGIDLFSTHAVIHDCRITHNRAGHGGGIELDGTPTISNCLIAANVAGSGGGVSVSTGPWESVTLSRCTIAGNVATAMGGGGLACHIYMHIEVRLQDSIVWGNQSCKGEQILLWDRGNLTLSRCNIQDGPQGVRFFSQKPREVTWGENSLSIDPGFVDPAACEFELRPDSPIFAARGKSIGYRHDPSAALFAGLPTPGECPPKYEPGKAIQEMKEQKERDRQAMRRRMTGFEFSRAREDELKHVSSIVFGYELTYPAQWQHALVFRAPSPLSTKRISWAERLRTPRRIAGRNFDVPYAEFEVTLWQVFDGSLVDLVDQLGLQELGESVDVAPGLPGWRSVSADGDRCGQDWYAIDYVVVQTGRAVHIHCACPADTFRMLEGVFDQIAGSLKLFAPLDNRPRPGTTKTFDGGIFTFEYPGEWIWSNPPVQDQKATVRSPQLFPADFFDPRPDDYDWSKYNLVEVRAYATKRETHERHIQWVSEAPEYNTLQQPLPFVTSSGLVGSRTEYLSGRRLGVFYSFPADPERVIVMNASCSFDLAETAKQFDRIAASLALKSPGD